MENKERKTVNLVEGNGVTSVSVDSCVNSYYADNIKKGRKLKVKRYEFE